MGSKLGWLPVDGASGDFLIQESLPLQGCVRSYNRYSVLFAGLKLSSFHFLIRGKQGVAP